MKDIHKESDQPLRIMKEFCSFIRSNLPLTKFTMGILPDGKIEFSGYPLTTVRGAFGVQLRKLTCSTNQDNCSHCLLKEKCVFAYVFDTVVPDGSEVMRKYPKAPHPFIFQMNSDCFDGIIFKDEFGIEATLIGKGIEYLPYIIYTFMELGKVGLGKNRGKFTVHSVLARDAWNNRYELLQRNGKAVKISPAPGYDLKAYEEKFVLDGEARNVTLEFRTPLRIKYDGRMVTELQFHHIVRSITRRLSLLSYFHCGKMPDFNVRKIIEAAQSVKVLESGLERKSYTRYSGRQGRHMEMGGIIGKVMFESVPEPFLTLLKLCELFGVGKNTSFGMGQIMVIY